MQGLAQVVKEQVMLFVTDTLGFPRAAARRTRQLLSGSKVCPVSKADLDGRRACWDVTYRYAALFRCWMLQAVALPLSYISSNF